MRRRSKGQAKRASLANGRRPLGGLALLVVGMGLGFVGTLIYQGIDSGESDGMGAGIKVWVEQMRDEQRDSKAAVSGAVPTTKTTYEFYDVLLEPERLMPEKTDQGGSVANAATPSPAKSIAPADAESSTVKKSSSSKSPYMLEAGAFDKARDADRLRAKLTLAGYQPSQQQVASHGRERSYRVHVGPFMSIQEMEAANQQLAAIGIKGIPLKF